MHEVESEHTPTKDRHLIKMKREHKAARTLGIQKEIELETTAYNLFTIKEHSSGLFITSALCLSVVYQPYNKRKR